MSIALLAAMTWARVGGMVNVPPTRTTLKELSPQLSLPGEWRVAPSPKCADRLIYCFLLPQPQKSAIEGLAHALHLKTVWNVKDQTVTLSPEEAVADSWIGVRNACARQIRESAALVDRDLTWLQQELEKADTAYRALPRMKDVPVADRAKVLALGKQISDRRTEIQNVLKAPEIVRALATLTPEQIADPFRQRTTLSTVRVLSDGEIAALGIHVKPSAFSPDSKAIVALWPEQGHLGSDRLWHLSTIYPTGDGDTESLVMQDVPHLEDPSLGDPIGKAKIEPPQSVCDIDKPGYFSLGAIPFIAKQVNMSTALWCSAYEPLWRIRTEPFALNDLTVESMNPPHHSSPAITFTKRGDWIECASPTPDFSPYDTNWTKLLPWLRKVEVGPPSLEDLRRFVSSLTEKDIAGFNETLLEHPRLELEAHPYTDAVLLLRAFLNLSESQQGQSLGKSFEIAVGDLPVRSRDDIHRYMQSARFWPRWIRDFHSDATVNLDKAQFSVQSMQRDSRIHLTITLKRVQGDVSVCELDLLMQS